MKTPISLLAFKFPCALLILILLGLVSGLRAQVAYQSTDSIAGLRLINASTYGHVLVNGYYAAGDGGGGAYTSGTWSTVIPTGTVFDGGTHSISIEWNNVSVGNPYIVTIGGLVPISIQNDAGNFGAVIPAVISCHLDTGTCTASLRTITAASSALSGVQFKSNLSWPAGGTLTVRIRKL